jgi:hypothetical protein
MFGFGGKKGGPPRVGAKEKIMKAQMMHRGRLSENIKGKSEGENNFGPVVVLIYILSVALAFVLMMGAFKATGLNIHTGLPGFDRIMFAGGVPSLLGVPSQDMILVPILRGTMYFILGGVLPFMTLLWIRAIDKPNMNPFIAVWGVSIGLPLVFFFCSDFLGPLLGEVFDIMAPS